MGGNRSILLGLCFVSLSLFANTQGAPLDQWLGDYADTFIQRLENNIAPAGTSPGVVVAAPSKKDPNYYFHWIRDASLVMDVVVDLYKHERNSKSRSHYEKQLFDFIEFTRLNQMTPNLSGGLGEPRFNVDGTADHEPWGRPQNDGPALRAITLGHLAQHWLEVGREDLVRARLYSNELPATKVLKADLEYVANHWRETCFDLWEEIRGTHFFTRMAQRRALVEGSKLADRLGDGGAADWYRLQAKHMEIEIERHWDASKNYILSTIDRDGGIDYKSSNLDTSVVLGVLHGQTGDSFFGPHDARVMATVERLESTFTALYPVNQQGLPGLILGRYPEDRYDGYKTDGHGNGWVLITAGFAEWYHTIANYFVQVGHARVHSTNHSFFEKHGVDGMQPTQTVVLTSQDPRFDRFIKNLRKKGDEFLDRLHYHAPDGRLSEQINRQTGFMQGAPDLTWSYAAIITAMQNRQVPRR